MLRALLLAPPTHACNRWPSSRVCGCPVRGDFLTHPGQYGGEGEGAHTTSDHPGGNPRISVSSARTMAAPASR
eukprot:4773154-Prymnesium_polylepis.2